MPTPMFNRLLHWISSVFELWMDVTLSRPLVHTGIIAVLLLVPLFHQSNPNLNCYSTTVTSSYSYVNIHVIRYSAVLVLSYLLVLMKGSFQRFAAMLWPFQNPSSH